VPGHEIAARDLRPMKVASVMGGGALRPFCQNGTGRPMADIAQTEHANRLRAFVDHRQSADFQRLHVLKDLARSSSSRQQGSLIESGHCAVRVV
jgi:hypothetical protein